MILLRVAKLIESNKFNKSQLDELSRINSNTTLTPEVQLTKEHRIVNKQNTRKNKKWAIN